MQVTIGTLSGIFAKRRLESFIRSQATVLDAVSNFKQISIGNPDAFIERFSTDRYRTARSSAIYATLGTLPRYITEISVMIGVGLLVIQRSSSTSPISAPTIAVFLAGIFRIVASMLPLQSGLSYFKHIQHDAELGFRMLEEFGTNAQSGGTKENTNSDSPSLVVESLDFGYEGSDNLHNPQGVVLCRRG
jgi:ABC-type multidrug transport system fused ATPase/permease subunit